MAVIRIKSGSGIPGSLVAGELALDTTNIKLYGGDGVSVYWMGALIENTPGNWDDQNKLATQYAINNNFLPNIGGTLTGNLIFGNSSQIRMNATSGGVNYIGLSAPSTVATSVTFTLPNADGAPNQFLKTNGSGGMSWGTPTAGAGGSNNQVQYNSSGALTGDSNLTYNGADLTIGGDINVNGGDIKSTSTAVTVFNTTATSVALGGSATVITMGAGTGTTTVNNDLVVAGNLTVNGSTITVNSTVTTLDDPVLTLGGDTDPISDDNKDRGLEFRWHNGSVAKRGFFGFDDSTGNFTFIPDATNTSEVFAGTPGGIDVRTVTGLNNLTGTTANDSGITITATHSDTNATLSIVGGVSGAGNASLAGATFTIMGDGVNGGKVVLREAGASPTQYGTLVTATLTADRIYTFPDAAGTVLTTGNMTAITTVGTVATGTWSATAIAANKGGTGQTSYTIGDVLYASTTSALSKLTASATAGAVLASQGSGTAPQYKVISFTNGSVTSGAGTLTLAVQNAAADGATKGIAAFNATSFTASAGVIDIATVDGGTY